MKYTTPNEKLRQLEEWNAVKIHDIIESQIIRTRNKEIEVRISCYYQEEEVVEQIKVYKKLGWDIAYKDKYGEWGRDERGFDALAWKEYYVYRFSCDTATIQ